MAELGLTPSRVSLMVTSKRDFVRDLKRNETQPNYENTERLAKALEFSVDYLMGRSDDLGLPPDVNLFPVEGRAQNRKPKKGAAPAVEIADASGGMLIQVPEYSVLGDGPDGTNKGENVRRFWGLPVQFLEGLSMNAAEAAFVEIAGDAMSPTLSPGDLVLLDLASRNPSIPAVYAIAWNGATICYQIESVPGSSPAQLKLVSANPTFSNHTVAADSVKIVGRAVWRAGRL